MSLPHDITTQEYIEVIRDLERQNRVARVKDIADRRGVSRSSVSLVLNQLLKKKLIEHEHYSHVTLSNRGRQLARDLEHRHQAIKAFLEEILSLPETIAEKDACRFEHEISLETLEAICKFMMFVKNCPQIKPPFRTLFRECGRFGTGERDCTQCNAENNLSSEKVDPLTKTTSSSPEDLYT
jgi:DtxR family Mn-dependent transcriptional regulator